MRDNRETRESARDRQAAEIFPLIAMISVFGYDDTMAQMMIRNLDDAAAARLKRRAVEQRTSVEEQARRVLTADTAPDIHSIVARMNAIAKRIGPLSGPTIVEDLRADRARDDIP